MESSMDLIPSTSTGIYSSIESSERLSLVYENSSSEDEIQESSKTQHSLEPTQLLEDISVDNVQNKEAIPTVTLPEEMIFEVIMKLDDRQDMKNCLKLSRSLSTRLKRSPRFLGKYPFILNCKDDKRTIRKRGPHIKKLRMECYGNEKHFMLPSLRGTPIVEELTLVDKFRSRNYFTGRRSGCLTDYESCSDDDGPFNGGSDYESSTEYNEYIQRYSIIELRYLESLTITNVWRESIMRLRVENLVKLSINFDSKYQCFAVYVDFFCKLEHLREINFEGNAVFRFPNRDYKNTVQCNLRTITMSFGSKLRSNHNFARFLESQANSVVEMNLNLKLIEDEFDVIFVNFTSLTKLKLSSNENFDFLSNSHPEWVLPSLVSYEQSYGSTIDLIYLKSRFPNLITFVGHPELSVNLENFSQNFKNLQIKGIKNFIRGQFLEFDFNLIDLVVLDLNELENSKFEYLKYLKAASALCSKENTFIQFVNSLKSVEFISFGNLDISKTKSISVVFNCLQNLKTLRIVEFHFIDHNLKINMIQKSVKCSWFPNSNNPKFKNILKVFKDFEYMIEENDEIICID